MDWEQWLRAAANPPSTNEDNKRNRTEEQIKDALRSYTPLNGKSYRVFAKGSYANNTNVRLDYDVDIAVEYVGYFYYDIMFDLAGTPKGDIPILPNTDTYTTNNFKSDVFGALETAFGSSDVTGGNVAFRVRNGKTTLPADVVPCWEYRRYHARNNSGVAIFNQGSRIYPKTGSWIDNFPEQQRVSGTAKNNRTNYRYKYMVRALKKLQTYLIDQGLLEDEVASYHVECLVYNVPDDSFGCTKYLDDMRNVLAAIFNATLSNGDWNDWEEVNGLKYLLRGSGAPTRAMVHSMSSVAWDTLGFE